MTIQSKLRFVAAAFFAVLFWSGPSMAAAASCSTDEFGTGANLLFELEEQFKRPGNLATRDLTIGGKKGFRKAALVLVDVWASADYTPPNPTWFFTTIKTSYAGPAYLRNKIVAREDSYRDGNAGALKFDNSVSYSEALPRDTPIDLSINSIATGPGAAGVTNTTLCIAVRVISLD
jgi:hypothetical protein